MASSSSKPAPNSVCVAGELDLATAECFVRAVRSAWIDVTRPVDVDPLAVTFFDASGLKALLSLRRSGVDVRLVSVSESAQRVLDITRIGCLFGAGQIPRR